MNYREQIEELLNNPDKLKMKKPFTRGSYSWGSDSYSNEEVNPNSLRKATLPNFKKKEITQEDFLRELDPNSHKVLFDENIPSIHQKLNNGMYQEINTYRMSIPIQMCIKNKQVMHLAANPMQFTLMDIEPTETQQKNFITFKQYWDLRNQDGMKYKMVDIQKSCGDVGLLYYFDKDGKIKSRILSYPDYVLCPHNDDNGDRILESVWYVDNYGIETIDSYDDKYLYRITYDASDGIDGEQKGWRRHTPQEHGFDEIPLITKRGDVAWNNVQPIIESFEELYNVFTVIQKRWGWGILYVKGKFKDNAKKIAGSIVLQDSSIEGSGDAKFLTPPTPQGTIDTLNMMLESIQLGSSTTFILPKDIKMSGDVSGIAVQLTQSQDNELALQNVIDWQNVADKMARLFKYGLAKELVKSGEHLTAITEFQDLRINAKFKVWRPLNDYEYNQMVAMLKNANILSEETAIEINTLSKPDEKVRVQKQVEEAERKALEQQKQQMELQAQNNSNNKNNKGEEE